MTAMISIHPNGHFHRFYRNLLSVQFAIVFVCIAFSQSIADPNTTFPDGQVVPGTTIDNSTPPSASDQDTVVTITAKKKADDVPKTNASQTTISSTAIDHVDPALTLPELISEYVPGATMNENNGLRIRGADDQFGTYLDGIPLPQTVNGSLTDVVDPADISTLRVYSGGVPAELGGELAAIFDLTTKAGEGPASGNISQSFASAGTDDTQGYVKGGDGRFGYFASASQRSADYFLNTPTENVQNDSGHEDHGFAKFDYSAGTTDSFSLLAGSNGSNFEIPDTEDTQQETGQYGGLTWQHINGTAFSRLSLYSHTSTIHYNGSPTDLVFAGLLDSNQDLRSNTTGMRVDQTLPYGGNNVFKIGFDVSQTTVDQDLSIGLPAPPSGPGGALTDISNPHAWNTGLYAQDDWSPGRFLVNYGVRYDVNNQAITTHQLSPRVNVKYRLNGTDTIHAFYDHLFQPIPVETAAQLVGQAAIGDNGTQSPLLPETDDFYEIGIDRTTSTFSTGIAAYYKPGHNVRDDDQVGDTNIQLPVDDAKSYARGIEFSLTRDLSKSLRVFGNLVATWSKNDGPITGGLSDSSGNTIAENYLYVAPHATFNLSAGKQFRRVFELELFADNILNHAYVIKQETSLSDAQWAQGRVIGLRASQGF